MENLVIVVGLTIFNNSDPCLSSNFFILRGWYFLKIVYSVAKHLFYNKYIMGTLATQEILRYRRMKTHRAPLNTQ